MRRRVRGIFTAAPLAALLATTSAFADDARTRWYGSFTGLRNMPSDSEAVLQTRSLGTVAGDVALSDETGFALAVGVETRGGQRIELEGAYRTSDIEGASAARVGAIPVPSGYTLTGEVDTWSLMVNVRQVLGAGAVRPYVGGGVGLVRHDGRAELAVPPLPPLVPQGLEGEASGDDTTFAYQLMAGVEVELSERATLFGGYRYLRGADLRIERVTASFDTHAVEAGVRVRF